MTQCGKCGSTKVLTESVAEGRVRVVCQECFHSELRDNEGRKFLTDDMGQRGTARPLMG